MKVGFIHPNNETSRFLATKLLETGNEVAFLCSDKLDLDIAENIIFELNMIGVEQDKLRSRQKSFSVEKYDLSDCEVIGSPNYFFESVLLNDNGGPYHPPIPDNVILLELGQNSN